MNLIIWTCGLRLRWHLKLAKVFLTSVFFCLGQRWLDKCDVITDTEARKSYLKNNKRCFNCLRQGNLSNKLNNRNHFKSVSI